MAQIIWDGNKNWENVWDGKQPWDREIEEKSIPENAVLIDRPDDIIKASIPYMIIPCIVCFVAIFTKKAQSDEFIFNLWFMPLSFIIGFFVAMPLHEFLHAISYPKGAKVYIGVSLKQLRAYAASSAALSRGRYMKSPSIWNRYGLIHWQMHSGRALTCWTILYRHNSAGRPCSD